MRFRFLKPGLKTKVLTEMIFGVLVLESSHIVRNGEGGMESGPEIKHLFLVSFS